MERHNEISEFIWNIKEHIRDEYKEKDYEEVILPFTLLRRIDCVLEKTHKQVVKTYEKYKNKATPEVLDQLLKKASGQNFYNISDFTLLGLIKDKDNIGENFEAYLKGFNESIKDIFLNFSGGPEKGLSPIYETLLRKELLYIVTFEFTKLDMSPDTISNHDMGTIFEILIRKSKEASNEKAGQFYTPREIVRLMVNLVFANETDKLQKAGAGINIYDPCCGTGGMLTTAKDYLQESINPNLTVYNFGQEINEQTYAIAKSDILMKGENADNIKHGNTITKDKLLGKTFNYMLTNPPFGDDWKNMREYVESEAEEKGFSGRFGAGTPDVSDGSFLFLQHMISKMNPQGSIIGIVFNGAPLFNGDAGGGWSNIRGWIMDEPNDFLDCIVAMPKDLFYGTGISTYIWILNNKKPVNRKNKVQLINAIHPWFTKKIKSLGKKQYEISEEGLRLITDIYKAYKDNSMEVEEEGNKRTIDISKIYDVTDFKYTKVTVERPLRLAYEITHEKITELKKHPKFVEIATSKKKNKTIAEVDVAKGKAIQEKILKTLVEYVGKSKEISDANFFTVFEKNIGSKLGNVLLKLFRDILGEKDEEAEVVFEDPFEVPRQEGRICDWNEKPMVDTDLRDSESIKWKESIDEYFEKEVLPFAADAWMDREKDKIGYEIPYTKYFYEPELKFSFTRMVKEVLNSQNEDDFKDSGISWIGKIPKHWEMWKLKFVAFYQNGAAFSSDEFRNDGDVYVIRIGDLVDSRVSLSSATTITKELAHQYPNVKLKNNDILLALTGATIGKSALFDKSEECYLNQRVALFRPRKNILKEYLMLFINSELFRIHIDYECYGGAQDNVGKPQILNAKIPLPPIDEQKRIIEFLGKELKEKNELIEKYKYEINSLDLAKSTIGFKLLSGKQLMGKTI
ncbi:restriction endonuclease subunit M [bacterium]|nr:restriction endonuclease subunit M [bacterium]